MNYKEYTVRVYEDRTEWILNDLIHRENGPAIEYINGDKVWYRKGQLHREDGPAIEYINGHKEWYNNGKLHREDGPAVIGGDGTKYWFLNYEELTEKEFNARTQNCDGKIVEIDGRKYKLTEI